MSKIDKHIEELLHSHDCVIVPNFGGFITTKQSAYYNKFTSVFHPAKKNILFNKHLVFNDGLLAAKVAEKEALSMEEAAQLLIQFKDDCYLKLNEEGRVEVEKVGVLFFDKEKNIQFQQSTTNFLNDSFGLTTLKIEKLAEKAKVKPIVEVEKVERLVSVKEDRKTLVKTTEKKVSKPRKKRRIPNLVPLLMIPVLAGCFFVISEQEIFNQKNLSLASLNPFSTARKTYYQPREIKPDLSKLEKTKNIILPEVKKEVPEIQLEVKKEVVEINKKIDSTYSEPKKLVEKGGYHIIAGCFSVKSNAVKLVEKWNDKGYNSSIVDKKGRLYRVSIQNLNSRKEAKSAMAEIKKDYSKSLWILKK